MSYTPYPAYKDSGVPWLGHLPEGWELKPVKYVSTFNDESLPETTDPELMLNYVDISSVSLVEGIKKIEQVEFEKAPSRARRIVREGDTIVSTVRTYLKAIAPIRNPVDNMIVSTGFAVIRPDQTMNPDFLGYFIQSEGFVGEVVSKSTGVSYPAINPGDLVTIPGVRPPIEEQTAIADFLDRKTAEIDDLIAKKEELLRLLAEQRTALITHAVTKGLNPNAPMNPSGIDWLGDVSEGWDVVPFKWCCQVQSGQVDPKLDEYKSLPLIAPDHIESGTGRLLPYESAEEQGAISGKYQFEAGEVLYSKIRPELSKVALAPEAGLCSADMYAIRALDGLRPEFLFYQMLSRHFHRFAVLESMRVAMPKINRESLGVFPVIVPDEDTQGEILNHIQSELSKMDMAEEKITAARDYLKEYRSAVITNAVTGKIKVA